MSKAERHSAATRANKERQAETRKRRRLAVAARRASDTYTYPDGRHKGTQARTGTVLHQAAVLRREEQAQKIAKKREQRENFRKLSEGQKAEHSVAGQSHKRPPNMP